LNRTCPLDRNPIQESDLGQPRRYFRNMLANLKLRCPFCSGKTTYGDSERHKKNCQKKFRENPDAATECTFCSTKYIVKEEELHKNMCILFLQQRIATLELKYQTEKKHLEKEIERMAKSASESRKSPYILTWNAKFPTPQDHQQADDTFYYTRNNYVGNLVDGTRKRNPRFKLDHGEMTVGLDLNKETDERAIFIQFYLTTGRKGRVQFNVSLSAAGKVRWQKEVTEELDVEIYDENGLYDDGWTGGEIYYVLPSDLPSNLLVTVEVIEWDPIWGDPI
jgi:hypothetical protein